MTEVDQSSKIIKALVPHFEVPLRHKNLSLKTVLTSEQNHQAHLIVTEAMAAIANDPLGSCYAPGDESTLLARLVQLSALAEQPEEIMVHHAGDIAYLAPHFNPVLRERLHITNPRPPFVSFLDGSNLVMAAPNDRQQWQYLSVDTKVSLESLIALGLRVVFETAEPASERVLIACQQATQHFGIHH